MNGNQDDPGRLVIYVKEQVERGADVKIKGFQYTACNKGNMQVFDDSLHKFVSIENQISFRSKDIMDLQPTMLTKENYVQKINDILAAR